MRKIRKADLTSPRDAEAVVFLVNAYAMDPMGGGQELSGYAKRNLAAELRRRPHCSVFLAYWDDRPAGLAVCFEGFSTFQCRPVLNIHDIVVAKELRRQGLGKDLLKEVEAFAIQRGCCKLTLEVLEGNTVAEQAYRNFGFRGYELDPKLGKAMFYEKELKEK
ncbi:MAG: GNAT family N-acetyltransferase [Verrucomicrobia bacterium]|jgi:GNAT superfamily N-acetyltransferase|nr:GNAT family N-acetyltransferase [Verrucomicrobiota bacterium]